MADQSPDGSGRDARKLGEAIYTIGGLGLMVWFFYEIRFIWLPPVILIWTFARMFAGDFD